MPQAGVRASWYGGAGTEPAGVNAETGISLDRSDTEIGTEPLPIPLASPNTVYSAVKQVALEVTGVASPMTTLSNATVRATSTMPTGAAWFYSVSSAYLAQLSSISTLAAAVSGGAVTVSSTISYSVNQLVQIDVGNIAELRMVTAVVGSGPYTLTLDRILSNNHLSGAQIAHYVSGAPADVGSESSGQPTLPTGFTAPTTSAVQYSPLGLTTDTAGRKGPFLRLLGAISSTFGNNPGTASLPSLIVAYDES